jgi:hypothetical protein
MWSSLYRWLEVAALLVCLGLLVAGLWMTLDATWNDEGWLARAGGLITLVSAWFVLPAEAERARITNNMHWIEAHGEHEIKEMRRIHGDALGDRLQTWFDEAKEKLEKTARNGIRWMELVIITVGTILWALGDLAKFAKHWLGLTCITCG